MANDFSTEYAKRSDEELLQLASERASLTEEAAVALHAELIRRHLSQSDQAKHEHSAKRFEQRESKRRLRKVFGGRKDRESWVDNLVFLFWSAVVMSLIGLAYEALPSRYHFTPDRQEAAVYVMFASVPIVVGSSVWRRRIGFWFALMTSSTIHFVLVHSWISRVGTLSPPGRRGYGRSAILLGFVLFFIVYGCGWLLRRSFYGAEAAENK